MSAGNPAFFTHGLKHRLGWSGKITSAYNQVVDGSAPKTDTSRPVLLGPCQVPLNDHVKLGLLIPLALFLLELEAIPMLFYLGVTHGMMYNLYDEMATDNIYNIIIYDSDKIQFKE